jgi:hypothetical protein
MNQERFYQPNNSKDAMRFIEKLFNSYKDAPLTQELLIYHQKLINQLHNNIEIEAQKEGIPERIKSAQNMQRIMADWVQIKMAGKPYNGRMHHFKFQSTADNPRFKRHNIKLNGNSSHRSSHH